ncbi:hypothetical protein K439DRAFT_1613636 [Ramaria rubella]|nr:hypothetical protein K439DRAFT_1613636 [Ramaria rubella]
MFLRASSDETLTSVTSSPPSSPPSSPASDQESQIHTHQVPDAPLDTIATQEEIEASFYERMAELEAQHNYEVCELINCEFFVISNVRAEFEELLQERMTEVQAVCNQEVYQLQNLLHAAEDRAQKEHRDKEEAQRKTLESLIPGLDLARLERELHARRLEDKQHELQQREARIAELEARIAELEVLLRDRDPESAIMIATKEREATEPEPEQLRCSICRMENKISELQLQEMELRVQAMGFRAKMSEQREGRLLNELHQERCMRLQAEAELADEAQMRRDAEIAGEVIARDARSPFVVPGLLDAFLKMQGFVG